MQGALKEKTIILTCFCGTMVVLCLETVFGDCIDTGVQAESAYSPIYLTTHIISLSRKNKKVFKNIFHSALKHLYGIGIKLALPSWS